MIIRVEMRFLLYLFISVYIVATSYPSEAQEVIVNQAVNQEEISRNTLRAIFGMRLRTWPDGTSVRVFVLRDKAPLHIDFCKKVLNVFPHQLRRAWDRLVFSGTGQSPHELRSEQEVREKVADTPGAIGYLNSKEKNKNVKVLEVLE